MRGPVAWIGTIMAIIGSLLTGCTHRDETPGGTTTATAPAGATAAAVTPATQPARDGLIPVGEPAPDFSAVDHKQQPIRLSTLLAAHPVVMVFYPADYTPGCTKQLCAVRDDWSEFQKRNALVLGVNPADATKHASFAEKYSFPFPIVVDENSSIAAAYGCKGKLFPQRTVYVIGSDGKVKLGESGMVPHEKIFAALDAK